MIYYVTYLYEGKKIKEEYQNVIEKGQKFPEICPRNMTKTFDFLQRCLRGGGQGREQGVLHSSGGLQGDAVPQVEGQRA